MPSPAAEAREDRDAELNFPLEYLLMRDRTVLPSLPLEA